MSFAVDANVLLHASDTSSAWHAPAREFMADLGRGPENAYLPWPVLMAYLRISTHSRIFANPLSPSEARDNVDRLLALRHVRALGETDGFWRRYRDLTGGMAARGNLVPDTHIAALLLEHGVTTLYTRDGDFRRFPALKIRDPFAAAER